MPEDKRYTVLGAGERYVAPAEKKKPGPPSAPPARPIAEARALLTPKISGVIDAVQRLEPELKLPEVVVELRLDSRFLAKSYTPDDLLKETGLTIRGTGTWLQVVQPRGSKARRETPSEAPQKSRALFVSGSVESLKQLHRAVSRGLTDKTDKDIVKIEDIRLPGPEDRLPVRVKSQEKRVAVEVVLYDWSDALMKSAVRRVRGVLERFSIPAEKIRVKSYAGGPTFIAAVAPARALEQLGEYNFLRVARPLPRVSLTKAVTRHAFQGTRLPTIGAHPAARIAIFDGGYEPHPLLDPYVDAIDLTGQPPTAECVEHGVMVASAAVFGPFSEAGGVPAPRCRALAYRILPDPDDDALELYGAIDALEKQVPKLPADVRVVNLSLGPPGPIGDVPSRFTYAIDRLAREHEVLFVTAVGNDGADPGNERIQAPSDSVNNMGIGAYRLDGSSKPEHAWYSCQGPGRSGGRTKPDVVAYGGCEKRPFYVLLPDPHVLGAPAGTSFASPVVAALAGQLRALTATDVPLSPEALRALLVHSATPVEPYPPSHVGHGKVADTPEHVLACSARDVSVLYQGTISPRDSWKLPFLLPPDFAPAGKVRFRWTIVYTPDVEYGSPDEYTLAGIEPAFRPHSDVYTFSPPLGSKETGKSLNIQHDAAAIAKLIKAGWKQSVLPTADTPLRRTEQQLRSQDRKWETIVVGERTKFSDKMSEPMLTVAVVGRSVWNTKDPALTARYAAVLTVSAPKYDGDLYADVLAQFDMLRPLTLRQPVQPRGRLRT